MKDDSARPLTRHAEWFCTHLADALGIAGPSCHVLEMPDGSLVFGSQYEGGVVPSAQKWWEMVVNGTMPIAEIRLILTRIYAFDHFVHNDDRHAGNFLCCAQSTQHVLLAFDYSRAWTTQGFPLPVLPFDASHPNERTLNVQRQLSMLFGPYIDPQEARRFLASIIKVTKARIDDIIRRHPNNWLPKKERLAIMKWWSSKEMRDRVEKIAKGIEDGSYL